MVVVTSLQHRSDPSLRIVYVRVVPQGMLPKHAHKLVLRLLRLRAKNERRGTQQHRHRRGDRQQHRKGGRKRGA